LTLRFQLPLKGTTSFCQFLGGFGPRCFQRRREGPLSHLVGTQRPEIPFFERFRRRFSLSPSVVIEICSALRSRYPTGDDSATIPSAVASFIFSVSKSVSIR